MNLAERCNAIEECYEFMLAYAAQGVADGTEVREYLGRAIHALTGLGAVARQELDSPFVTVLDRDAGDALAAAELVLAQPAISSQLIDNLNASIHLRALLTDLFLIDEVLKASRAAGTPAVAREHS
ncbi:MAG: hypothetical protein JO307_28070 [Bryobacterales bacterium]|nr:hypothetical protein [Bryobacterales bacterium]MBV9400951.1 hypothetical protein [Bryobacterales bacterium]